MGAAGLSTDPGLVWYEKLRRPCAGPDVRLLELEKGPGLRPGAFLELVESVGG